MGELSQTEVQRKRFPSRGISRRDYNAIEMQRLWRPVFDKYDTDNDGKIPLEELKVLLAAENNTHGLHPNVIAEIVERSDWNKDNFITYNEFEGMVLAADLGDARPKFQHLVKFAAFAVVPKGERATTIRRYMENYNCMPPPIFLLLISLVEVAVYIYYCVELSEFSATGPVPIDSPLIYNPHRRKEAWRYLTYMLIHAGAVHVFFNLLVQLALGIPLELVHKWWRVGLVYLAGVLAGSLGASLSDPYTYLAGASGGVYALIAAHLANVIVNFKEMEYRWYRLGFVIFFTSVDVAVALYNRYGLKEKSRTSYASHFGGALAGLLVGVVFLRNLRVHPWEKRLGWVMLAIYIAVMVFAIFWNAFYNDYYPKQTI